MGFEDGDWREYMDDVLELDDEDFTEWEDTTFGGITEWTEEEQEEFINANGSGGAWWDGAEMDAAEDDDPSDTLEELGEAEEDLDIIDQEEFDDYVFDAIADLDMEEWEEFLATTDPSGQLAEEVAEYFAAGAG